MGGRLNSRQRIRQGPLLLRGPCVVASDGEGVGGVWDMGYITVDFVEDGSATRGFELR